MLIDHWPLLGLRLTTPRLELRLPSAEELSDLADLAAEGMHSPGSMPFLVSWPALPPKERARALVQRHWRHRGEWSTDDWSLTSPSSLMDNSWASRRSRPMTTRCCEKSAPSHGLARAITGAVSAPRCAPLFFTWPSLVSARPMPSRARLTTTSHR